MKRNILVLVLVILGIFLGFLIVLSSRRLADFYYSQMISSTE